MIDKICRNWQYKLSGETEAGSAGEQPAEGYRMQETLNDAAEGSGLFGLLPHSNSLSFPIYT